MTTVDSWEIDHRRHASREHADLRPGIREVDQPGSQAERPPSLVKPGFLEIQNAQAEAASDEFLAP
jgi:hypothetical protein